MSGETRKTSFPPFYKHVYTIERDTKQKEKKIRVRDEYYRGGMGKELLRESKYSKYALQADKMS